MNTSMRKQKDLFTMVSSRLPEDRLDQSDNGKLNGAKRSSSKTSSGAVTCSLTDVLDEQKGCVRCAVLRRIWMFTINIYDFMGLLEICPCSTLHPIRPYMSYIKSK